MPAEGEDAVEAEPCGTDSELHRRAPAAVYFVPGLVQAASVCSGPRTRGLVAVVQRVVTDEAEPAVVIYRDGRAVTRFPVTAFVDDFDRFFDRETGYRWSPQVGWSFQMLEISTRDGDFVVDPSSGFIERQTPAWTDGGRGLEVALARMLSRAALLGLPAGAVVGLLGLLVVSRRQRETVAVGGPRSCRR